MRTKIFRMTLFIIFMMIIYFIGSKTFISFSKNFTYDDLSDVDGHKRIEESFRNHFYKKDKLIDIFGLEQKILNRNILGNFEFALTDLNMLDIVKPLVNNEDVIFAERLLYIKRICDKNNTKMLYVQMPARSYNRNLKIFGLNDYYDGINQIIKDNNIDILKKEDLLHNDLTINSFYFKSDIHPTTDAEIRVVDLLKRKLKLANNDIYSKTILENTKNFTKIEHNFIGNLVFSVGKYFVGEDKFVQYIPKFDTQFFLKELYGNVNKEGNWENVLMNGYNKLDRSEDKIYWVTDYLMFGSSGYEIINYNAKNKSILFICDSMCYRTISYLALNCHKITILDPRFFYKTNKTNDAIYKEVLNKEKYDMVVVLHGTFFNL